MIIDPTAICFKKSIEPSETLSHTVKLAAFRGGLRGFMSIQGLVENGGGTLTISYSNNPDLGWLELDTVDFEADTMKYQSIDTLYPCKYIKYELTNENAEAIIVSLEPCYI